MPDPSLTTRELQEALDRQSDRIMSKMDRVEDRLSNDILMVKADCEGDVTRVEARVDKVEDEVKKNKTVATLISSVVAVIGVIVSAVVGGR